jgi:hypothetical protein
MDDVILIMHVTAPGNRVSIRFTCQGQNFSDQSGVLYNFCITKVFSRLQNQFPQLQNLYSHDQCAACRKSATNLVHAHENFAHCGTQGEWQEGARVREGHQVCPQCCCPTSPTSPTTDVSLV